MSQKVIHVSYSPGINVSGDKIEHPPVITLFTLHCEKSTLLHASLSAVKQKRSTLFQLVCSVCRLLFLQKGTTKCHNWKCWTWNWWYVDPVRLTALTWVERSLTYATTIWSHVTYLRVYLYNCLLFNCEPIDMFQQRSTGVTSYQGHSGFLFVKCEFVSVFDPWLRSFTPNRLPVHEMFHCTITSTPDFYTGLGDRGQSHKQRQICWDMTTWSLKMKAPGLFEKSGSTRPTTRRHIPEDVNIQLYRCKNLKSRNYRQVKT
jgi:hypothetical protein